MRPFIAPTVALFVAMMLAVFFLARRAIQRSPAPPSMRRDSPAGSALARVREVD
jgi:hypothetical protein